MLLMPDASSAILDPATEAPTLSLVCEIADPITRSPTRRTRAASRAGGGAPARERDRRHRRTSAPSASSSSSTRSTTTSARTCSHYSVDSPRGLLELRQAGARLHRSPQGGLLPGGALGLAPRPPHRDGADARAARHPVRVPPPRGRVGRPVRDRPPLHDADPDGRPGHDLQVRRQERRPPARQDRDLHAEADLRRQRLGHAHAPVAVDGRNAADGGQVRLCGALAARPRLHRRAARPRAGAARVLRADHELVPAARPGFEAPVNLVYSQRNRSACIRIPMYSDSAKAKRIEFRPSGLGREPVPRVLGDADGGAGRDRAQGSTRARPRTTTSSRTRAATSRRCRARSSEALDALERDHEFLLEGEVFSKELIETWIAWKRENEIDAVRSDRIRRSSRSTTTARAEPRALRRRARARRSPPRLPPAPSP